MSTERAEDIYLAEAQRAADQWMAVALRRIAVDDVVLDRVRDHLHQKYDFLHRYTAVAAYLALADVLEHGAGGANPERDERSEI